MRLFVRPMLEVYGNKEVAAALHSMVESGRIPHAILFHEDDGGGAFPLVLNFLEEVYGGSPRVQKLIHPDIHFVFPVAGEKNPVSAQFAEPFRELLLAKPYFFESELYSAIGIEGKQSGISVAEARSILDSLSLTAVEGGFRSVVMYLPEKMNAASANALLKMVEEPPENTLFLLVTHAPEKVLVTIASRCLSLRVEPLSEETDRLVHSENAARNVAMEDLFHDLLSAVVSRDLLSAIEVGDALADLKDREQQKAFCRLASDSLRKIFLLQQKMPQLAKAEDEFFARMAGALRPAFPRVAVGCLEKAQMLIERNVNQKLLFTEMVTQIYSYGTR